MQAAVEHQAGVFVALLFDFVEALPLQHADAVERRMFEVLGQGEEMITRTSERIPEQPRFAFAAGLIALVIAVGLLIGAAR